MIISHSWLAGHYDDPDLVMLDSRGNVAYSYGHIPKSQPLEVEKVVVEAADTGANPVLETENAVALFGSLGIDDTKTVVICGDYMDPSAARIAWTFLYFGHEKQRS